MKRKAKKLKIIWKRTEVTPEESQRCLNRVFDILFEEVEKTHQYTEATRTK
jgi:hypothetical protein